MGESYITTPNSMSLPINKDSTRTNHSQVYFQTLILVTPGRDINIISNNCKTLKAYVTMGRINKAKITD